MLHKHKAISQAFLRETVFIKHSSSYNNDALSTIYFEKCIFCAYTLEIILKQLSKDIPKGIFFRHQK